MTSTDRYNYAFDPDGDDWAARLLRQVPPDVSVLELGPGPGAMTKIMVDRGHAVTVVENDPGAVQKLTALGVEVLQYDLNTLTWRDQLQGRQFGALLACDVLEHLNEPLATLEALRELASPAARLVISMPNVAYAGLVAGLRVGKFDYADTGLLDRTHMRFFTRSSLGKALMAMKWAPEHWEGLHLPIEESEFIWDWQQLEPTQRQALVSGWADFDVYEWMTVAVPMEDSSAATIKSAELEIGQLKHALHELMLRYESEHGSLLEHQKAFGEARAAIAKLESEVATKLAVISDLQALEGSTASQLYESDQRAAAAQAEVEHLKLQLEALRQQGVPGRLRRLLAALRA